MRIYRVLLVITLSLYGKLIYAAPAASPDGKGPLVTSPVGVSSFLHMALGLLIVIGAIFAMTWLVRRTGYAPKGIGGAMKILSGISLGQRERVVLMQVGDQQLVVGIAPGNIRTLLVLDKPVSVQEQTATVSEGSFAQKLQAILKGKQP